MHRMGSVKNLILDKWQVVLSKGEIMESEKKIIKIK